jgi:hypothetical protein
MEVGDLNQWAFRRENENNQNQRWPGDGRAQAWIVSVHKVIC